MCWSARVFIVVTIFWSAFANSDIKYKCCAKNPGLIVKDTAINLSVCGDYDHNTQNPSTAKSLKEAMVECGTSYYDVVLTTEGKFDGAIKWAVDHPKFIFRNLNCKGELSYFTFDSKEATERKERKIEILRVADDIFEVREISLGEGLKPTLEVYLFEKGRLFQTETTDKLGKKIISPVSAAKGKQKTASDVLSQLTQNHWAEVEDCCKKKTCIDSHQNTLKSNTTSTTDQ